LWHDKIKTFLPSSFQIDQSVKCKANLNTTWHSVIAKEKFHQIIKMESFLGNRPDYQNDKHSCRLGSQNH